MKTPASILAFAGSPRKGSYNMKLARIAAAGAAAAGAKVTVLDLADLPMPLYSEDLEAGEGIHPNAHTLKELMKTHDGFIIASPENNSSVSAFLKNAIDWASRSEKGEPPLACYKGKTAVIMSASPSGLGGLRGLTHLRSILHSLGVIVLPDQKAVSEAYRAFNEKDQLIDTGQQEAIYGLGGKLADITARLNAS